MEIMLCTWKDQKENEIMLKDNIESLKGLYMLKEFEILIK